MNSLSSIGLVGSWFLSWARNSLKKSSLPRPKTSLFPSPGLSLVPSPAGATLRLAARGSMRPLLAARLVGSMDMVVLPAAESGADVDAGPTRGPADDVDRGRSGGDGTAPDRADRLGVRPADER